MTDNLDTTEPTLPVSEIVRWLNLAGPVVSVDLSVILNLPMSNQQASMAEVAGCVGGCLTLIDILSAMRCCVGTTINYSIMARLN